MIDREIDIKAFKVTSYSILKYANLLVFIISP